MLRLLLVATDLALASSIEPLLECEGVGLTLPTTREGLADSVAADPPDAVALDLGLPNEEGWDLLSSLRERLDRPSLPIIGLTSQDAPAERLRAFALGANDVLRGPFDPHELVLRARGVIASLRGRSAALRGRLELYPLGELLQSCERSSWSGLIQIVDGAKTARIHFQRGKILDANAGRLLDVEALWSALESARGDFVLTVGAPQETRLPIVASVRGLLIDLGWATQELNERAALLPAPDAPLALVSRTFVLPEALPRLPTQRILDLLEARGPMSPAALLEEIDEAPTRIRLALAVLLEKGALAAQAPALPIISVFYSRAAHSALRAFLASLPSTETLPPSLSGEAVEVGQRIVRWHEEEGAIVIRYEPLSLASVAEMFHRARAASSVVLWLGTDLHADGIPMPLQLLHTAARQAEHLLLVAEPPEAGRNLLSQLEGPSRWVPAPEAPGALASLLRNGSRGPHWKSGDAGLGTPAETAP